MSENTGTNGVHSWLRENRFTIERIAGLVASCGCFAIAGSLIAFTEYALALKEKFNLTQTQVELTESMWSFSNDLGYPAGLMGEKLGTRVTLGIALSLVVVVYMLLWATKFSMQVYITHQWLFYIYYFLLGFGSCCGFVTVLPVMLRNFKSSQHGAITGLLFSFFSVGPAVYAAIYGGCFIDGHPFDAAKQDLSGYFLFDAISCLVLYLLGIIFIKEIPRVESNISGFAKSVPEDPSCRSITPPPGEATHLINSEGSGGIKMNSLKENSLHIPHEELKDVQISSEAPELKGCALLRTPEFQLILWPYIFCSTVALTFFNNLSAILKAFHHESFITLCAVLSPIVGIIANLALGTLSDYTASKFPRVTYQLVVNVFQAVFLVTCVFYAGNVGVFIFTVICVSASAGGAMTISPTILTEISGTRYFGRNLGGMIIGQGISVFVLQIVVGVLYDANKNANNNCYGERCFRASFIILSVLSVLTVMLQARHLYTRLRQRKKIVT